MCLGVRHTNSMQFVTVEKLQKSVVAKCHGSQGAHYIFMMSSSATVHDVSTAQQSMIVVSIIRLSALGVCRLSLHKAKMACGKVRSCADVGKYLLPQQFAVNRLLITIKLGLFWAKG